MDYSLFAGRNTTSKTRWYGGRTCESLYRRTTYHSQSSVLGCNRPEAEGFNRDTIRGVIFVRFPHIDVHRGWDGEPATVME